ncbi:MAG: hypothetical protein GAK43_00897 [Stenotrophomonas maltophilia]|nr:MAG: hypothetical protein GAK43_00897 [Stenotrophomonas maltophilia]
MLGGRHPRASIEVHDVVFALGEHLPDTFEQLRGAWFGSPKGLHVDAWMAVDGVDDYRVELSHAAPAEGAPRLFFVNLGGYEAQTFGEAHRYLLVVAADREQAKARSRSHRVAHWDKPHTDALLEVDDCIPIDCVEGRYLHLVKAEHRGISVHSDYIILS